MRGSDPAVGNYIAKKKSKERSGRRSRGRGSELCVTGIKVVGIGSGQVTVNKGDIQG